MKPRMAEQHEEGVREIALTEDQRLAFPLYVAKIEESQRALDRFIMACAQRLDVPLNRGWRWNSQGLKFVAPPPAVPQDQGGNGQGAADGGVPSPPVSTDEEKRARRAAARKHQTQERLRAAEGEASDGQAH